MTAVAALAVLMPAVSWAQSAPAARIAPSVHAAEAAARTPSAAQLKAGEDVYKAACLACHQANGKGLPGAFPPLAQSDYLLKDKTRAIASSRN